MSMRKIIWPVVLSTLFFLTTVARSSPTHNNTNERLERPYPLRLEASARENALAHQSMRHLAHDVAVALGASPYTLSDTTLGCINATCRAINTLTADTIYSQLNTPTADRAIMGGLASTMAFICLNQIAPQLAICGKAPTIAAIASTTLLMLGALIQWDQRRLDTSLLEGANRYEASHRDASRRALIATFIQELQHYGFRIPNPTPETGFIEGRDFGTWLTPFLINAAPENNRTPTLPLSDRVLFNLFRPENRLAQSLLMQLTPNDLIARSRFGEPLFRAALEALAQQPGGQILVGVDVERHSKNLSADHFHEQVIVLTFTVVPGMAVAPATLTPPRVRATQSQIWLEATANRPWVMRVPIWALPQLSPEDIISNLAPFRYQLQQGLRHGTGLLFRAHELLPNSLPARVNASWPTTGVRINPTTANNDPCSMLLAATPDAATRDDESPAVSVPTSRKR